MNTNIEDWNNSEIADALEENYRFIEEVLDHILDEDERPLYEWDRSDLIDFAYEYLNLEEDED